MSFFKFQLDILDLLRIFEPILTLPLVNWLFLFHLGFISLLNDSDDHFEEKYFDVRGENIRTDGINFNN